MEWVGRAARWVRECLAGQAWLEFVRPSIEALPDWALLTGSLAPLVLALLVISPRKRDPGLPAEATLAPVPAERPINARRDFAQAARGVGAPSEARTATDAENRLTGIPSETDRRQGARMFISSTFLDMKADRDALVGATFLALRRKYRERGVEVFDVDLRWGVTETDITMEVCLREVDRCRPYFIGLIGQRYGTRLRDDAISPDLLRSYPVLRDAAGKSLTEIEILQGVLSQPEAARRALFFERNPAWLQTLPPDERAKFEEGGEEARASLEQLKRSIVMSGAAVASYDGPGDIDAKASAAITGLLDQEFPDEQPQDEFAQSHRLHAAYARDRLGFHVGGESYLRMLDNWREGHAGLPALITGPSGAGKSTLIANWLQSLAARDKSAILFAHYLGASPDSADPVAIMGRIWRHLDRATGETIDAPDADASLIEFAVAFSERLARANVVARARSSTIVIALDGLDKLSSGRDLRWWPPLHWSSIKLLTSSLDGEACAAARERGWQELEVRPLSASQQEDYIAHLLKGWGKSDLPPARKRAILNHPLAGLPLFLKTVLEELRVSAIEAVLDQRLAYYLEARDAGDLFSRVLIRLENEHPGLTTDALGLIGSSRAGLEEAELIALTKATPLAWAKLRNSLGDNLRDQMGRVAFAHDYLLRAVERRYLGDVDTARRFHLRIAERFEGVGRGARRADELPYQLQAAGAWNELKLLLTNLDDFPYLLERGEVVLLGYWRALGERGEDLATPIVDQLSAHAPQDWSSELIVRSAAIASFLRFAGAPFDLQIKLQRMRLEASEQVLSERHELTIEAASALGDTLRDAGKFNESEPVLRRALALSRQVAGAGSLMYARIANNLGALLAQLGRTEEAEALYLEALAIEEKAPGPPSVRLAIRLNNLALVMMGRRQFAEAARLLTRAAAIDESAIGAHPEAAARLNNLALVYAEANEPDRAEPIYRRVIAILEDALGKDHPKLATALNNLAVLHHKRGDTAAAEPLYRRVIELQSRALAEESAEVGVALSNLGALLMDAKRLEEAVPMLRRSLDIVRARLGDTHPTTAVRLNALAKAIGHTGQLHEAEVLSRAAVSIDEAGADTHALARDLSTLVGLLRAQNRWSECERLWRQLLDLKEQIFGASHPSIVEALNGLGETLRRLGRAREAEAPGRRALAILDASQAPGLEDLAGALRNIAKAMQAGERFGESEVFCRRLAEIEEQRLGPNASTFGTTLNDLAIALLMLERLEEAEVVAERALKVLIGSLPPGDREIVNTSQGLATIKAMRQVQRERKS